jgi:hypothetical protein
VPSEENFQRQLYLSGEVLFRAADGAEACEGSRLARLDLRSLACLRVREEDWLDRGCRSAGAGRAEDRGIERIESLGLELKVDLLSHFETFLKAERYLRRIGIADDALPGIRCKWNPCVIGQIREAARSFAGCPNFIHRYGREGLPIQLSDVARD